MNEQQIDALVAIATSYPRPDGGAFAAIETALSGLTRGLEPADWETIWARVPDDASLAIQTLRKVAMTNDTELVLYMMGLMPPIAPVKL